MAERVFQDIESLVEQVRQYKPDLLEDETFQGWLEFFQTVPPAEEPELWHRFQQHVLYELRDVLMDPFANELPIRMRWPVDAVNLGWAAKGDAYVPVAWFPRNLLVLGQTGSGKTNTLIHLAGQIDRQELPVWVFDFKDEYQELVEAGFTEIDWHDLKLNPLNILEPPDAETNLRIFQEVWSHSQALWHASQALLGEVLAKAYRDYGSYDDQQWPSLDDLREVLWHRKVQPGTPMAQYKDRLINRLNDMLLKKSKDEYLADAEIFNCQKGFSIEKLMQTSAVFRLQGLKPNTASFLAELLMVAAYQQQITHQRRKGCDLVIVSDEAKHVFHQGKERTFEGEVVPMVNKLISETREYSIGLCLADHQATNLTRAVAANTGIKLVMSLASGEEIKFTATDVGLGQQQLQEAYRLKTGESIGKIAGQEPVKIQVPQVIP